ncbi:MBL fold metallo-hydrolase [Thermodesulfobacteriota bacterium]
MKLNEYVYLYLSPEQGENNCNSIVIDGKVPLLIDPGRQGALAGLMQSMDADGFDPSSIKLVIATHAHPDHMEGTVPFARAGAKIAISQQEERYMENEMRPMYVQQGQSMPEYMVDFWLTDGTLNLGKHEFRIIHGPGHSPGSLCIYWSRFRILVAGDVVFAGGVGRSDLPGGNGKQLKESIDRLSGLPVEFLIPGHGSPVQGAKENADNFIHVKNLFLQGL